MESNQTLSGIPKWLYYGTGILLFGLIVHFIVMNFFQFVVGLPKLVMTALSLWKEIIIWLLCMWVCVYRIITAGSVRKWREALRWDTYFRNLSIGFAVVMGITLLSSIFNGSRNHYIIAWRYDFIPFVLLLLGYQIAQIIWSLQVKHLTNLYIEVMRRIIGFGLLWYFIISSLPWALKLFGYDRHVYEGKMGQEPPAVYYAALDHGAPRNQFLWERPIFYWFYLVAFWPLFFLLYLRKTSRTEQVFYWWLYILNIFSTFSRSAWLAWIIQTVLLFFLLYGKQAIKYLKYLLIPLIGLGWLVGVYFYYEIFWPGRQFSNTGHINAFLDSMKILKTNWLLGLGAGTAWPASHQLGIGFNPENQYLQIWIEYGIVGFLVWLAYYWYLNISWLFNKGWNNVKNYRQDTDIEHWNNHRLMLLACNIGLLWLSLCGLVLHSLGDKMSFWPLMLLYGLRLATKKQ